jgi:hypothetical protein
MQFIIKLIVLSAFCAVVSNAFLFSHKFKDGCDPDPCKHKAKCVLDPKNKNISTCMVNYIYIIFNLNVTAKQHILKYFSALRVTLVLTVNSVLDVPRSRVRRVSARIYKIISLFFIAHARKATSANTVTQSMHAWTTRPVSKDLFVI